MNIAQLLYPYLLSYWTEDNPTSNNISWKFDEFDPKNPSLQVLIENFPERSTWVTRGLYRTEHRAKITLYLKLIHYNPSRIEEIKVTWFNAKMEINRILAINKFNITGVSNLNLPAGWDDKMSIAVGRGTKTTKEPIIWQSEQIVVAVYYVGEELEAE